MPGHLFQTLNQTILDLLFPPHCVNCKSANSWLCQSCLDNVSFIRAAICERCGAPAAQTRPIACVYCQDLSLQYLDGIRAVSVFEDNPIRPAIHRLKYGNHRALAAVLAAMLAEAYQRYALAVDVIIPVPLHPARLRERGYNQSELLARQLSLMVQIPLDTTSLQRVRKTASQVALSVGERRENVANAFSAHQPVSRQRVLLVDDVCTTGSTLDACAMALKASGAASVWGLTVARAC